MLHYRPCTLRIPIRNFNHGPLCTNARNSDRLSTELTQQVLPAFAMPVGQGLELMRLRLATLAGDSERDAERLLLELRRTREGESERERFKVDVVRAAFLERLVERPRGGKDSRSLV